MYGRQSNTSDGQPPPPWLVRAEVTIHHGTPVTSESGQAPVSMSSTVTDSSGVRMVYRWNTNETSPSTVVPATVPTVPSASSSSSSYGFQRGNILFTSTPPPRPPPASFTIPRSGLSSESNEFPSSTRTRSTNVSDSGYNSERFSPQSYSSLPSRYPSQQQYNRRCKSTCSIVLSSANDGARQESTSKIASSESVKHSYDNSWRHHSTRQHVFTRHQFSTVPEVSEECSDSAGSASTTAYTTHFCSRLQDKVTSETTTVSKDASSQTTDIESQESASTVVSGKNTSRRKERIAGGIRRLDEQRTKQQKGRASGTTAENVNVGPRTDSRKKPDSPGKDDVGKRKSRTVHIDVYCTGSDDNEIDTDASSETTTRGTPMTVYENPDMKVTHTEVPGKVLPRGFQGEKASSMKRATEQRYESFKYAPMRLPSIASSKGYDTDDALSSLYPSRFSSYTALHDLDSAAWSAASSNAGIPFDYDSSTATSSKDTLSDIESLLNTKLGLTPCDSFEYASSTDRERIRQMEETWAKPEGQMDKRWKTERAQSSQNRKVGEHLEKRESEWSSVDSTEDSDESSIVGWCFVSSEENQRAIKRTSTVRETTKSIDECAGENVTSVTKQEQAVRGNFQPDRSDSTIRNDSILQPYVLRDQVDPFGSKSSSPHLSKVPSRVTSPFMTPQGERTDHSLKASIFGTVVNAFRKPGHHIGPSKNPSCSCEHCRRHFQEVNNRERSSSISEFERQTGFCLQNEKRIVRPIPKNSDT